MADFEVSRIRRDRGDMDRRIDMLAGPHFGPAHIDDVIADILSGANTYHVIAGFWPAVLEVLPHPQSGRLFLRTVPDGLYDNNLHTLPEIGEPIPRVRRLGRD